MVVHAQGTGAAPLQTPPHPCRAGGAGRSLLVPTRGGWKDVLVTSLLGAPLPKDHTCPASCLHLWLHSHQAPFVLPVPDTPRESPNPVEKESWESTSFRSHCGRSFQENRGQRPSPNLGHDLSVPRTPG